MASFGVRIGIISLLVALAPVAHGSAAAHHVDGYTQSPYGGFYGNPFQEASFGGRGFASPYAPYDSGSLGDAMPGYRCYYRGKDGSCMNYSYQHGPSYGWDTLTIDPFVAPPYGYHRQSRCHRNCHH